MSFFARQKTGSVVCPECGRLVGVQDEKCLGCGRTNPGLWGFAPVLNKLGQGIGFGDIVITICGGLFIITMLLQDPRPLGAGFGFDMFSPGRGAVFLFGWSGAEPIFGFGRWWTVLSAAWLHGGLLHIVMNMSWIRTLVPELIELYGVGRTIIIYTVSSITGFGLTSMMYLFVQGGFFSGAQNTMGASAPLFGLFGALIAYGQMTGSVQIGRMVWTWIAIFVVIGLLIEYVDNMAHLGGFVGGWICARIFDPRRNETPQQLIVGMVCLAASLLSIVVSVLHGLQFFR